MSVHKHHYGWIACLYFFQSLPYVVVATIAALCYQQYGMSNATVALLTSLFMLPWCIKPLFAPIFEKKTNKKAWLLVIQVNIGLLFFLLALTAETAVFLPVTIAAFLGLAVLSSINDIISDGLYLLHLSETEQKRYVGLRSCFYQLGRLTVKGGFIALAAGVASHLSGNPWPVFFGLMTLLVGVLIGVHWLTIPTGEEGNTAAPATYRRIAKTLLQQPTWRIPLLFVFLYNMTDAQIQKIVPLFLLDPHGLGLSMSQFSLVYGFFGSLALISGISLAGFLSSQWGTGTCLKRLTPLLLPSHFLLVLLTQLTPANTLTVGLLILQGQFIAGLMNGAYMTYLLGLANQSPYPMSMYTLCTSIMALSYIVFGALSGWIQSQLGYADFFLTMMAGNGFLLLMIGYMTTQRLPQFSVTACIVGDNTDNFC